MITPRQLKQFLEERPAISLAAFAHEVGCSARHLKNYYTSQDSYALSPEMWEKLRPMLVRYGWREVEEEDECKHDWKYRCMQGIPFLYCPKCKETS